MSEHDWVAQLDQARAGLGDMAGLLHSYYAALVSAGFNPDQAMTLTANYQGLVFAMGMLKAQETQEDG